MTYLQHERHATQITNKGVNVPPKIVAGRHHGYGKEDKNSLIYCLISYFLFVKWGRGLREN